ncbi:MAG: hypothetical protein KKB88_05290 [Nanoarchaeota archaeon]|nr:hypothetical protein [Nanoarchaeota archaeon]
MSLNLNPAPQNYKTFPEEGTDKLVKLMPKLIAEGRNPLSVAGLMEARLKHGKDLSDWMDNYFFTGDAVVYHPDGRVKVVTDSEHLRGINSQSELRLGALILHDGVYDTLQGQEFTRSELEKHTGDWLSAKTVKKNPLWKALARDQNLLNEYTDFTFSEAKTRFKYDKNMGVYLSSATGDSPLLRAWYVGKLGLRSDAYGRDDLDIGDGRFVGVSTGGAEASKKSQKN